MNDANGPSIAGTRLDRQRYAQAWADDVHALAVAAAAQPDNAVPGCPEWTMRDLVSHVVGVYRHKIAALDTGGEPEEAPDGGWGALAPDEDAVAALTESFTQLSERLAALPLEAPAWSWWPAEQTAGFWVRRMAQETAVHRWDAESAAYGVHNANPIADDLALDGIDELLGWLAWVWPADPSMEQASGQAITIGSGDGAWTATVRPTHFDLAPGADVVSVAHVSGAPSDLLLHLWGRPTIGVSEEGDAAVIALFRSRLSASTD